MSKEKKTANEQGAIKRTWFWNYILNNQVVMVLVIVLLTLLCLLLASKLTFLLLPIETFFSTIGYPLVATVILYYLIAPTVDRLERHGINRSLAIIGVYIAIVLLLIWGASSIVPVLERQTMSLVNNIPAYAKGVIAMIEESPFFDENLPFAENVLGIFEDFDFANLTNRLNTILQSTFGGLGNVLGTISSFVTGAVIVPILLYYLLLDGGKLTKNILYYIPTKNRPVVSRLMYQTNFQVAQYVRGQISVAVAVGIMFSILYSLIGLDYAVTLGVMSGFLNIIPFLGSMIAAVPALIIGLLTSPFMFIKVALCLVIEQTIEGRIISPQILGSNLEIHPVTILIVLLVSGNMFGLVGVVIGLPAYAILKVFIGEFYGWYREYSVLYEPAVGPPNRLHDEIKYPRTFDEEMRENNED